MFASSRAPSVASSVTLGRHSMAPSSPFPYNLFRAAAESEDVEMRDAEIISEPDTSKPRFTIAVDFGTTFSSVSFVSLGSQEQPHLVGEPRIQSINNYPNDQSVDGGQAREVPTEMWYPTGPQFREAEGLELMESEGVASDNLNDEEDYSGLTSEEKGSTNIEEASVLLDGDDNLDSFLWGYMVQDALRYPDAHRDKTNKLISRFKLLLDNSKHTEKIRKDLALTIRSLKKRKIIKKEENLIADYLTSLFRHVNSQLRQEHHFTEDCVTEFVLCVPAIWTQKACRTMQAAMASAMVKSGFRGAENGSVQNLFIVSEPEAAAAYVLEDNYEIKPGETFVLLDAGGGTVDATTYTVNKTVPLRLIREEVNPGGRLCGSSYLNEEFKGFLEDRLKNENYLEHGNITIDGIIESIIIEQFENRIKRQINLADRAGCHRQIFINGLRPNKSKNFTKNRLHMYLEDFEKIFERCLKDVSSLMMEQLDAARAKGLEIHKVILIGGFAASPSLKWFLEKELKELSKAYKSDIRLLRPETPGTAVASGAVLRALNKEDGPARYIRSSYGFLRTEPHEPEVTPAHRGVKPWYDPLDGNPYVKNTIDWVVKKDELVDAGKVYEPLRMCHTFPAGRDQELVCKEELYVSDTSTESSYRKSDPKNKGAELAGEIVVDMTFLRRQNRIQVVEPAPGEKGKKHYRVEFDLLITVDGRNLRYVAKYPPGGEGEVLEEGQTCIAAAFLPGTN